MYTVSDIIANSNSINKLYFIFIKNLITLIKINMFIKTLLCETLIIEIFKLFSNFNKNIFDIDIIKFDYILNSKTIYISDIDTGIGYSGDIDFVQQLSEKDTQNELEDIKDDEYRNEGMDIEQDLDEDDTENMGDEDVQTGVGEK